MRYTICLFVAGCLLVAIGLQGEELGCRYECQSVPWGQVCVHYEDDGHALAGCTGSLSCIHCVDLPPSLCCLSVCDKIWCFEV